MLWYFFMASYGTWTEHGRLIIEQSYVVLERHEWANPSTVPTKWNLYTNRSYYLMLVKTSITSNYTLVQLVKNWFFISHIPYLTFFIPPQLILIFQTQQVTRFVLMLRHFVTSTCPWISSFFCIIYMHRWSTTSSERD